jgi:hypothetical protein
MGPRETSRPADAVNPALTVAAATKLEAAEHQVAELESRTVPLPDSALVSARQQLAALELVEFGKYFDAGVAAANAFNDPSQMNKVDTFRQSLTPSEQKNYDNKLQALRDDKRISITAVDGKPVTVAERELALRGILTASYGTPQLRNDALADATKKGNGKFDVFIESSSFEQSTYGEPAATSNAGMFTQHADQDIVITRDFLMTAARNNDNALVHEFSHAMQSAGKNGKVLPTGFSSSEEKQFKRLFEDTSTQALLVGIPLKNDWGTESFPTIQNLFRQRPADLQRASPELYQLMVNNMRIDPLKGVRI